MRRQFVCVRVTRLNGIDLNRFKFDMDTTWNAFFADSRLNIYSRYGGRDGGEPDARMSVASLLHTMREVLVEHAIAAGKRRFQPRQPGRVLPRDLPLLKANHNGCIRCHQVREYQLLQSFHDGRFQRRELFGFPLPENIGLTVRRGHGHQVDSVRDKSPAAVAGLKPGDLLTHVNDVPVHSEYDIRYGLDRARDGKPLRLTVLRPIRFGDPAPQTMSLTLPADWWVSGIGWRKSLRSAPFPSGMRGYSLASAQRAELGISPSAMAIRISAIYADGFARNVGLKKRDVVVGIPESVRRVKKFDTFVGSLLGRYRPGEKVTLKIFRNGKPMTLSGKFPGWFTAETSVP